MRREQAEIVTVRHKAIAAPSIDKMEKQPLLSIKLGRGPFVNYVSI